MPSLSWTPPPTRIDRGPSLVRGTLLGLDLFIGVSAGYGAVMLVTDSWHLPLAYLAPLPLHSWVLPGLALLLVVAVPMLASTVLVWRRAPISADASIVAGASLVGWILVQLIVIGPRLWLQPVMLVAGLLTAGLAWSWRAGLRGRRP